MRSDCASTTARSTFSRRRSPQASPDTRGECPLSDRRPSRHLSARAGAVRRQGGSPAYVRRSHPRNAAGPRRAGRWPGEWDRRGPRRPSLSKSSLTLVCTYGDGSVKRDSARTRYGQDDKLRSVGGGKALADVLRVFELVDESDGVVFGGDGAFSLLVGKQLVFAEAELAGALAGLYESGRREISPGKVGFAQHVERVAVGDGDVFVLRGQVAGVDEVDTGSDEEAAGSANKDETAHVGHVEAADERAGGVEEIVDGSRARAVGADDGVDARDFRSNILGVEDVSLDHVRGRMRRNFGGVADNGGDVMAARDEFVEDSTADHSGCAEENDVHEVSPCVLKDRSVKAEPSSFAGNPRPKNPEAVHP